MKRFLFWMLFASGLGFFKVIALAYMLSISDFGRYGALFGIASLAGIFVSAGLTEQSTKSYPRWWVDGDRLSIRRNCFVVLAKLTRRFVGLGLFGYPVLVLGNAESSISSVLCVVCLGCVSAWLSQLASIYRAIGSNLLLQRFVTFRATTAVCFSLLGGYHFGWVGAFFGEIVSGVVTILLAALELRGVVTAERLKGNPGEDLPSIDSVGSRQLYFANVLSSSVGLVDRAAVGSAIGGLGAGSYGAAMLLPQIVQLIVNVIAQRVGPLIIKRNYLGFGSTERFSSVGSQLLLSVICAFTLSCIALLFIRFPFSSYFFVKYGIVDVTIIVVCFLAASQVYSLIEFHLIARDLERYVLFASFVCAVVFVCLFSICGYLKLSIEMFLLSAGVARWCQIVVLLRCLYRSSPR